MGSTYITSSALTASESAAIGGIFGMLAGMVAVVSIFCFIIYILLIIAQWKIFTKAGEEGWKSLIPIYNAYIYCKIIGVSFWKWVLALFVIGFVSGIATGTGLAWLATIASIANVVAAIALAVIIARNTAKAFGKGTGFAVGLFFLPNIFQLILAFGSAQYQGVPEKN